MSDFAKYRARAERMKRLEIVLECAKNVFAAAQVGGGSTEKVWLAMAKLREAVANVDKTTPPSLNDVS